jgi:light-harvesting complex II chlorophyll a/b binding protein 5
MLGVEPVAGTSVTTSKLILPSTPYRCQAYELIHARWAMLGVVGAIIPEACNKFGANCNPKPVWFKVLTNTSQNYHTTSVVFSLSQIYTGELYVIAFI